MNKKTMFTFGGMIAGIGLIVALVAFASPALGAQPAAPAAPNAWPGYWQMGPSMNTSLLGCTAGDGLGRFTGIYYETTGLIYFLGGRCETDTITTGSVFTFNPETQQFAVTGAVMATPVSNYTMARIENDGNGHGVGFYIVGGRTASGGQSSAVQVYYPGDNTVATISTDPFPPTTPYSPGSVVSVNDKLYVFGGFSGTAAYATTYKYDPAAGAGSRWSNTNCNLPTGRSYIAGVGIGTNIYSIGGSEWDGAALVAINDTEVLDTANMAACWQDNAMADLPQANDNTQAVYVNEGFLAGGIYMVGGMWTSPGPYRWVFAYNIATDTWDETFPQLVVPSPATGRRNHALVYVPSTAAAGIGTGIPGIWAFGGYDGSAVNAQTETSEFYSYLQDPVNLIPDALEVSGLPGTTVNDNFILKNNTDDAENFNLSVTADVAWTYTIPSSVGPVGPNGGEAPFPFSVDIPAIPCPASGVFTVTATSVLTPTLTASQAVTVHAVCGIGGTVVDATTGDPVVNAYVWAQTDPEGLTGEYFDGFTDAYGAYVLTGVTPGTYYMSADAPNYQPAFYPAGWPDGAAIVTISSGSVVQNFELEGSRIGWSPDNWDLTLSAGGQAESTLTLSNTGTAPLEYTINVFDGAQVEPPQAAAIPELPRVDPQLAEDLNANGAADFVVVLNGQADVTSANSIKDWNARGEYVYNILSAYAERSQASLRHFLASSGVSYTPLYIINAVIVHGGNMSLVNSLAARADVAQIIANHQIKVETISWVDQMLNAPTVPEAVEWNIAKVNADDVWGLGYNGAGMVVAEIDTGTQWDHPALKPHYRGWDGATADHNYNWFDPYAQCPSGGTIPCDGAQHGTHVMGTMIGDDGGTNKIGMAPGAKWIACKGGDAVSGYLLTNELLQCAQWILAPTDSGGNNPDPAMRPNVVNNSWGGGPYDYWFAGAVAAWRAAGIFPSFAAGNAGPGCSTAHSPGDYWNTFASGATDVNDNIGSFSSRGPAAQTGILKPQISAPGVNIRSSIPGNAYQGGWNGTSMATPHTSGAVALLWSAAPDLVGQIDETGWLLEQTALPRTTNDGCGGDLPTDVPNNTFGYGRLNILAAVNAALAGVTPDWLTLNPVGGEVAPGASSTVTLTFNMPATAGVYTATVWIVSYDPYHHDVRLPVQVTVLPTAPTAAFTSNSPVQVGSDALFTSTSTGTEPMTFLWDFGDGVTSTLQNPSHLYTSVGDYNVSLTASNSVGSDSVTHTFSVVGIPPAGTFVAPPPGTAGVPATFTVTVEGTGPFEYLWDFGDGITSTLASPSHTFAAAGTYTVTVTVTSEWGSVTLAGEFVVNEATVTTLNVFLPVVRKNP